MILRNLTYLSTSLIVLYSIEWVTLKKSQDLKNLSKSAYYCIELLLLNLKIGKAKDALKFAMDTIDILKNSDDKIKQKLNNFIKELEEIIENNLEITDQFIEKADIIIHKIRINLK